ncbi:MAG: aldehyde dehydrogenase family protein [Candidatus Omnitrophota bacterium]
MKTVSDISQFELFIDGKKQKPLSGRYFDSISPSTGEIVARLADGNVDDAKAAIAAARRAFDAGIWTKCSVPERGKYLIRIAELIRENAKELAQLECIDTGKTIKQTTFIDVPTCADTFEYFGKIEQPLQESYLAVAAPVKSLIRREPVGVAGCVIPWNYPLIMAAWKIAPALVSGNAIVFKPAQLASVSIMRLAEIIEHAGLPKGVINFVSGSGQSVGSELARNADVDMINFTGSTATGQEIMRLAASNTKKICLELGGKSPNIIFADCDLEAAVGGAMSAIFMNQGQMCTAGSRLLLEDKIYDEFMAALIKKTKALKIGNSINYDTDFGPLISAQQREQVLNFIKIGIKEGAKLSCGGKIPESADLKNGFFLEPAIFENVKNSMTIAQEEIFGPVLAVIKFSGEEEAVKIANDTKYGLAACVWTKDPQKANTVARQLRCGTVWINTYGGFYNEAPFGGYKQSGFGRELGTDGLLEYSQVKHICADQTPGGRPLVSGWF